MIWLLLSFQAYVILLLLGAKAPMLATIIVVPLMALSQIIPISKGGIGFRELIAIYFLSLIGISAEKSATFSLVYTFAGDVVPGTIGAILNLGNNSKPQIKQAKDF